MSKNINVSKMVTSLISVLDARQKEVLECRYGLKDGDFNTLAEVGEKYGVTRERIRQIEASGLHDVRNVFAKSGSEDLVKLVKTHLKNIGGVRRDLLLMSDLKLMVSDSKIPHLENKVHFVLDVAKEPKFSQESDTHYSYWYLNDDAKKKANSFNVNLVKAMEKDRKNQISKKADDLQDLIALNYVSVSKKFHVNEYGDFGLSHWPEVNPRTVKDWSYVVLKKNEKPLHFSEIAKHINKVRKTEEKVAHPQTVHNELIKDERFVLVGRGTYGLQEFGIMPGTAKEVISKVLEKHGPMKPQELLKFVLAERAFKKNTIFINLQNKKHFKRGDDGRYTTLA